MKTNLRWIDIISGYEKNIKLRERLMVNQLISDSYEEN